jgi:hypothetical protein
MIDPEMLKAAFTVQRFAYGGYILNFAGEAMISLMPAFEAEDSYGNGPAWEALADYVTRTNGLTGIELDSESDAMIARCSLEAPLRSLADALRDAANDEQRLRQLIREARADGAGHGDL